MIETAGYMLLYMPPIIVKSGNQISVVGVYITRSNIPKLFNFELYKDKDYSVADILSECKFIYSDKDFLCVKEFCLVPYIKENRIWQF